MNRYLQIAEYAITQPIKTVLDLGVGEAQAAHMLTACGYADQIEFTGVDLFDDITPEILNQELMGMKKPLTYKDTYDKLSQLGYKSITLIQQNVFEFIANNNEHYDVIIVGTGLNKDNIKKLTKWARAHADAVFVDYCIHGAGDFGAGFLATDPESAFVPLPLFDHIPQGGFLMIMAWPVGAYKFMRYSNILRKLEGAASVSTNAAHESILYKHIAIYAQSLGKRLEPFEKTDLVVVDPCNLTTAEDWVGMFDHVYTGNNTVLIDFLEGNILEQHGPVAEALADLGIEYSIGIGNDVIEDTQLNMAIVPKTSGTQLSIQSNHCVSMETLERNIEANTPKIKKWLAPCAAHDLVAVIVGAGPSLSDPAVVDTIVEASKDPKARLFVSKRANELLKQRGVTPFGMVLLDPRGHMKEFVDEPHPDVTYFAATMVEPNALDMLLSKTDNVIGYNPHIGASKVFEKLWGKEGTILVTGGSTSGMRALNLLVIAGFKKFRMYCFDSCYNNLPTKLVKTHQGFDKVVKIEAFDKEWITDMELLAQVNDTNEIHQLIEIEKRYSLASCDIEFVTPGLCKEAFEQPFEVAPFTFDQMLQGIGKNELHTPRTHKLKYKAV